ncbi:MAG TPA: 16S rRNA (cytidine(1402)-2'-O)-methyltransferase [Acetobacteraceae bacterium]|nr:16S rRNA (cytidine(1402)-2'-O)-methyltransferase [Acetobacteraceae bacterium]
MSDRSTESSENPLLHQPIDPALDTEHDSAPEEQHGGLLLVSTPIGNLRDITARAVAALRHASLVLCEDTRVTARLFAALGITTRLVPLHEHNEDSRIPATLDALREGRRVALVSDAGTPLVSDPGYRLVRAAIAEGLPVSAIPGANAATLALVLSGLPPLPFLMLGFPPPKQAARRAAFARLRDAERAGLSATLLWYEAPHRVAETLADMAEAFGPRPAAVARELTKKFEEVRRGSLAELAAHYGATKVRGEVTVVVGAAPAEPASAEDLDEHLRAALASGSVKDAVAHVVATTGLPRRTVYARALVLAGEREPDA